VVIAARNAERLASAAEELRSGGAEVEAIPCNIREEEDVVALFARIKDDYAAVDPRVPLY
ncbi:MAG: SDR family NAD(P)-dependent oxidoreductase, partial [Candidatus Poribacteria bacterium]